jgi:hypothetical protein
MLKAEFVGGMAERVTWPVVVEGLVGKQIFTIARKKAAGWPIKFGFHSCKLNQKL